MKKVRLINTLKGLSVFISVLLMQSLAVILCILGIIIYKNISGGKYASYTQAVDENEVMVKVIFQILSALLSFVLCAVLYNKSDMRKEKCNYNNIFSVKNIVSVLAISIGSSFFLSIILNIISLISGGYVSAYSQNMEQFNSGNPVFMLLYIVLIGPVSEEVIFRGAILDRFRKAFPFMWANILQALLFGVYHGNFIQGFYSFLLGVILGMLLKKTNSIIIPMSTHVLFNISSCMFCYIFVDGIVIWLFILLMIISLFVFISGFRNFLIIKV